MADDKADWIAKATALSRHKDTPDECRETLYMLASMASDMRRDLRHMLGDVSGTIERTRARAKEYGVEE